MKIKAASISLHVKLDTTLTRICQFVTIMIYRKLQAANLRNCSLAIQPVFGFDTVAAMLNA